MGCSYRDAHAVVTEWLELRNIALREATSPTKVLSLAVEVAEDHGIGKRRLSNFDCFHYAHAKAAGQPILTLDSLLRKTDLEVLPANH
ncbi:type II toxin-antitoxin system VapC family toxin [Sphingopyxis sp. GC21]|uniref:type II toxin-antitoxin system VapC family toxin n=1 Tax=Sphingopyxis sp. GC21 TaxID=2933562 RepID=UPI0021E4BCE6|nr:type II toxin-antitoxin system VapC family toxin [Sphingopyxis sp. GC21]